MRRRVTNLEELGTITKFTIEVSEPKLTSAITYVSVSPSHPTSEVSRKIMTVRASRRSTRRPGRSTSRR